MDERRCLGKNWQLEPQPVQYSTGQLVPSPTRVSGSTRRPIRVQPRQCKAKGGVAARDSGLYLLASNRKRQGSPTRVASLKDRQQHGAEGSWGRIYGSLQALGLRLMGTRLGPGTSRTRNDADT